MSKSAIVIGAGIAGLAAAKTLAARGFQVTVIERTPKATGASIRNFGMIWPIGQPDGMLYETAMRSREIWKEFSARTNTFYDDCGSIHVASTDLEWRALEELYAVFSSQGRRVSLLNAAETLRNFPAVQAKELKGSLFSSSELIVDPRVAIASLPAYLEETSSVKFVWNTAVTEVSTGRVKAGQQKYDADMVVVCSGADFETLYPSTFASLPITKCKLQMLRMRSSKANFSLRTAICGGLSLTHYDSFKAAPAVAELKKHFAEYASEYVRYGIHVMVCQNGAGELTVGDSHEYDLAFDPFDKQYINQLILEYLKQIVNTQDWQLVETWNGVYPKLLDDRTHIFLQPEKDVYIFNGLRGAGMTLSFGLAERLMASL
jgi:FAD dependent oxidoreductase TIGR03364